MSPQAHIVDDDADVRNGLLILLETAGYPVQCHASAETFWQAMEARLDELVGCLIVDVRMPGWSGFELQRRLVERHCALPLIFLTGHGELPDAVEAMRLGASDFLVKPVDGRRLLERIEQVWQREMARCRLAALQMEVRNGMRRLTGRERQVLAHALDGLQNPAIAAALQLSERTVEAHRSRLLLKLDAPSLQAWLQRYEKAGLVRPVLLAELSPSLAENRMGRNT